MILVATSVDLSLDYRLKWKSYLSERKSDLFKGFLHGKKILAQSDGSNLGSTTGRQSRSTVEIMSKLVLVELWEGQQIV